MDPRVFLRVLIERLAPVVGSASPGFSSAWEGEEAALNERTVGGRGHLAQAVLLARRALFSEDDEIIRTTAIHCLALERTGLALATRRESILLKRKGGKTRGAKQTDEGARRWAPYRQRYQALVAAGKSPIQARTIVQREMVKSGFSLPGQPMSPSNRTIRKWLK
jgi:hypothetical protein